MLDRLNETIVAISSAPGHSALGIVRLSGPGAISIVDSMSVIGSGKRLLNQPTWTRVEGEACIDTNIRFPALFYLFREPRSYTRQNLVEIHTVGSPPVLALVRGRAVAHGALPAMPGEFTARAFLAGVMDLSSAEAVAGVIQAQTDTQLRASRRLMDGALAQRTSAARDALAELLALVEAGIDFAEEPIEFISLAQLRERLGEVQGLLQELLTDAVSIERLDSLPRVLLLGPPNAGKSSLMNRLSGVDRAICAAVAGTTRDILSAPIRLGRSEAVLLDSAGVDATAEEIIVQARAHTLATASQVDLICLVFDAREVDDGPLTTMVRSLDRPNVVAVANKCDLVSPEVVNAIVRRWRDYGLGPTCAVSALSGAGLDELRRVLSDALGARLTTTQAEAVFLNERQRAAVRAAADAVDRATELSRGAAETADRADLLAFELREALDVLGEVTGEITTDDLLGRVFARFCIGK